MNAPEELSSVAMLLHCLYMAFTCVTDTECTWKKRKVDDVQQKAIADVPWEQSGIQGFDTVAK